MTVNTFTQPDNTAQSGAAYKTNLDAGIAVHQILAGAFAPHQQTTADMTVAVDAGVIFNVDTDTRIAVAAQNTATLTAPATNPRNDIIYIDETTGAVAVATGTEAASPSDPAIPASKIPIAKIALTVGMTEITNADLIDYRTGVFTGWLKPDGDGSGLSGIGVADQVARDNTILNAFEIARIDGLATKGMVNTVIDTFNDAAGISALGGATHDTTNYLLTNGSAGSGVGASSKWQGQTSAFTFSADDITGQSVADRAIYSVDALSGVSDVYFTITDITNVSQVFGLFATDEVGSLALTATASNDGFGMNTMTNSWWMHYGETAVISDIKFGGTSVSTTGSFTEGSSIIHLKVASDGTVTIYDGATLFYTFTDKVPAGKSLYFLTGTNAATPGITFSNWAWSWTAAPVNVTPQSNSFTAGAAPATLRPILDVEEIDTITINTDVLAKVSRDGGTTWSTATLAQISAVSGNRKVWAADVDVSGQPTGTAVRIRVDTANTKEIKMHQWAIQADQSLTI